MKESRPEDRPETRINVQACSFVQALSPVSKPSIKGRAGCVCRLVGAFVKVPETS